MNSSTSSPVVSVLLCVYNGERYLAETIESALAQSFRDFELVIIDDGSTDGSAAIVERYQPQPCVRFIRQENGGQAGAVKAGLAVARGRYIAILDHDDVWDPANLDVHVGLLEGDSSLAASFSWFRVIDEAGNDTGLHSTRHRGAIDFRELLIDFVIGASSNTVMRRSAIDQAGGIDLSLPLTFDFDLCLRLALLHRQNIVAIPRDLMKYRRHPGQSSRNPLHMMDDWHRMVAKMRNLAPRDVAMAFPRALSNQERYIARLHYEAEDYPAALRHLRRASASSPGSFLCDRRNWLTLGASLSGALLPRAMHQELERRAGFRRTPPAVAKASRVEASENA